MVSRKPLQRCSEMSQKVSGAVFLSKLSGGNPERYWPVGKTREIDDWPSVNLLVRKSDFLKVRGFNSKFWPGEDTKFILDFIKKLNKKRKSTLAKPEVQDINNEWRDNSFRTREETKNKK